MLSKINNKLTFLYNTFYHHISESHESSTFESFKAYFYSSNNLFTQKLRKQGMALSAQAVTTNNGILKARQFSDTYSNQQGNVRSIFSNNKFQWIFFILYIFLFIFLRISTPINKNFLGEFIINCEKYDIDIEKTRLIIDIDNTLSYLNFFIIFLFIISFFLLKYKLSLHSNNISILIILISTIIFSFIIGYVFILIPFSYKDEKTIFLYFWFIHRIWVIVSFYISYLLIGFISNYLSFNKVNKESCFILSFIIAITLISFFIDLNLIWAVASLLIIFFIPDTLSQFLHKYVLYIKNNKFIFIIIFFIIGLLIGIYINSSVAYANPLNVLPKGVTGQGVSRINWFHQPRNPLPLNGFINNGASQNTGFLTPFTRDMFTLIGVGTGTAGFGLAVSDSPPTIKKHIPVAKEWVKTKAIQTGEHLSSAHGLSQKYPPK